MSYIHVVEIINTVSCNQLLLIVVEHVHVYVVATLLSLHLLYEGHSAYFAFAVQQEVLPYICYTTCPPPLPPLLSSMEDADCMVPAHYLYKPQLHASSSRAFEFFVT